MLTGFRQAADTIGTVNPALIVAGFVLQILALACYSFLTRASLGTAGAGLSHARIFRIQLSTKALSNIVPGGNAAGSALGYRLLTLSGVSGPDAGFALATAGIGSAVVLNIIFWLGLVVSIPIRGVNPLYGIAAILGVIIMGIAAMLVIGLTDGQGRAEQAARWIARKLRLDEDKFAAVLRQVGERMEELVSDRVLLRKVVFWATLNWLFDAASLWMFLRAFGGDAPSIDAPDRRVRLRQRDGRDPDPARWPRRRRRHVSRVLVSFGIPKRVVVPAIAAYRSAQYLMPIALGALAYASLRVGPVEDRAARPAHPSARPGQRGDRQGRVPDRLRTALPARERRDRRRGPAAARAHVRRPARSRSDTCPPVRPPCRRRTVPPPSQRRRARPTTRRPTARPRRRGSERLSTATVTGDTVVRHEHP